MSMNCRHGLYLGDYCSDCEKDVSLIGSKKKEHKDYLDKVSKMTKAEILTIVNKKITRLTKADLVDILDRIT